MSIFGFATPLLAMCIFGLLAHFLVTAGQQQRIWIADFGLDNPKVVRSIEKAGVPAFPIRQKRFNLVTKTHVSNVTEQRRADNDTVGIRRRRGRPRLSARLFLEHAHADYRECEKHAAHDNQMHRGQPAGRSGY